MQSEPCPLLCDVGESRVGSGWSLREISRYCICPDSIITVRDTFRPRAVASFSGPLGERRRCVNLAFRPTHRWEYEKPSQERECGSASKVHSVLPLASSRV